MAAFNSGRVIDSSSYRDLESLPEELILETLRSLPSKDLANMRIFGERFYRIASSILYDERYWNITFPRYIEGDPRHLSVHCEGALALPYSGRISRLKPLGLDVRRIRKLQLHIPIWTPKHYAVIPLINKAKKWITSFDALQHLWIVFHVDHPWEFAKSGKWKHSKDVNEDISRHLQLFENCNIRAKIHIQVELPKSAPKDGKIDIRRYQCDRSLLERWEKGLTEKMKGQRVHLWKGRTRRG
jgi:hypothetical protein